MEETHHARWLDFSGAPPLLIPQSLAPLWRGTTDPATGVYRDLDTELQFTDYDRACFAAWPGRSILELNGQHLLAFYSEFDLHAWDADRLILGCGRWFPSDDEVRRASWSDAINWRAEHAEYLLLNSAVDASAGLRFGDYMPVQLQTGVYTIEYAEIKGEFVGSFHRFTLNP